MERLKPPLPLCILFNLATTPTWLTLVSTAVTCTCNYEKITVIFENIKSTIVLSGSTDSGAKIVIATKLMSSTDQAEEEDMKTKLKEKFKALEDNQNYSENGVALKPQDIEFFKNQVEKVMDLVLYIETKPETFLKLNLTMLESSSEIKSISFCADSVHEDILNTFEKEVMTTEIEFTSIGSNLKDSIQSLVECIQLDNNFVIRLKQLSIAKEQAQYLFLMDKLAL